MLIDSFIGVYAICKYYSPTKYNIDALLNKYFWFSERENLNDPFDLAGFSNSVMQWLLCSVVSGNPTLGYMLTELPSSSKLDFFKEYASCSFSRSPFNRLMWAYYTNNYQGWCLVFRTREVLKGSNEELREVIYVDDTLVPIDNNITIDFQKDPEVLLRIKHKDWQHEQEERIIIKRINNNFKREWADDILMAVIVGHNINEGNLTMISKYCYDNNIDLFQTKQSMSFDLDIYQLRNATNKCHPDIT